MLLVSLDISTSIDNQCSFIPLNSVSISVVSKVVRIVLFCEILPLQHDLHVKTRFTWLITP